MLNITLWDENASRLQTCHANLTEALKMKALKAKITCQSEPPLLSRMGLLGTGPTVEIGSQYWRCIVGKTITVDNFIALLSIID